ncbi:putative protein kinase RLK-Pelle-LRR-XII-1 family [Rosa chinensis]|uniref:Protein kinase domain-containing protein n=1 Tax=Rosa chinensis TaxID=74649 RepID=A0A2P6QZ80_ROSCH|nr:putative protein kinase RLK-Pelle-LRR-XII-1 family [Rosa chinensis]
MPHSLLFLASTAGDYAFVMLRLRDGLKHKPSGWSASDHCMWDGVECDSNHRVVSINMASKALSGSLPPSLNALMKVTRGGSKPFLVELKPYQELLFVLGSKKSSKRPIHKYANQKLVRRDFKPANVLLGEDFTAEVADFGLVLLCSSRNRSSSPLSQPARTPGYWAPECLAGSVIDKADVYSFGVILMELITGKRIDKATLAKAIDGEINSMEDEIVSCFCSVAELAIHCTERELNRRPHMSHAVMELSKLAEKPWKPSEPIVDDNPLIAKSMLEAVREWNEEEEEEVSTLESRTTRKAGGGKDEGKIREEDG